MYVCVCLHIESNRQIWSVDFANLAGCVQSLLLLLSNTTSSSIVSIIIIVAHTHKSSHSITWLINSSDYPQVAHTKVCVRESFTCLTITHNMIVENCAHTMQGDDDHPTMLLIRTYLCQHQRFHIYLFLTKHQANTNRVVMSEPICVYIVVR